MMVEGGPSRRESSSGTPRWVQHWMWQQTFRAKPKDSLVRCQWHMRSRWPRECRSLSFSSCSLWLTASRCSIKFVAVVGLTGVEKSSIIKTLTGEDVHVEHTIHTGSFFPFPTHALPVAFGLIVLSPVGTTTFVMFPTIIDEQCYILIDTPGFNDQVRTDMEVFEEILKWFHTMTPYCDLAGILYVHDITPKRFNKSAVLNLDMLEALCGEEFFKNVTILTTMWGDMNRSATKAAEKRQREFEQDAWKTLIAGGARVFSLRHGVAEPEDPITEEERCELEKQRNLARGELEEIMTYYKTSERVTPRIQKEVSAKVDIMSTKAGGVLRRSSNLPPPPNQMDSNGMYYCPEFSELFNR